LLEYTGEAEHLIIPANLGITEIGTRAFSERRSLVSISIPASVNFIGEDAFSICRNLTSIIVDERNATFSCIDGVLFNKDTTILIKYPPAKNEQSYIIPSSVIRIDNYAFAGSFNLRNITIPESVTAIGEGAFSGTGLTSVTIPKGVTVIEFNTFSFAFNLTSVNLPEGVTAIGDHAFVSAGLTSITIPSSVTFIGEYAFLFVMFSNPDNRRSNFTSISVDERNASFSSIDGVLFNKDKTVLIQYPPAKGGQSYVIPSSVTTIRERAFHGNLNLERVTIPNSVALIERDTFFSGGSLNTIIVSRNTRIERDAIPGRVRLVYSD
jgi:hypothetical protein